MRMRHASLAGLVFMVLSLGTVTPAAAQVQTQRPDTSAIDDDRLTAYAKAFAAIAVARDQAHAGLALPKSKTDATQKELREKLHKQIEQILREQGLSQEQYTRITYVISTDAEQRKRFEEILARLTAKPGTV